MPSLRQAASAGQTDARQMTKIVTDVRAASESLSREERAAYREAKESVVEARRRAPTHEGRLQIS
jgi:hypothetical protein